MKRQSDFQAEIFIRERKRNNRLRRAVALLCAVVMLLTMNSLKMSADTLEHIPGCGLEEHKHTLACYPLLCPLAEAEPQYEIRRAFIGDLHPHIHSEDCYDDNGVLACGYVESLYYHVHSRWCYDDDGNLVCGLNEIRPHQHTEACYQDVPTLVCGQDEYPAHHHTEECYFTVRELACGLEENPGHIHTDACYYDHNELTCGLEESVGHVHTSECYIPVVETTCGMEEGPGHIHTEECYTRELICGELESEDHQHTDECYADVLTCEIPEGFGAHTHTESCYTVYNILVCGIPEGEGAHRHTIDCVTSYHTLICGIPEGEGAHTHTDNCYINYDYLVCGQEETEGHTHTEECYVHTQELICGEQDGSEWVATMLGQEGVQVHTHTDECFTTFTRTLENGEQRTLRFATCGYVEIPTITSQESDWTSYPVQISEGHTHTAACYDLDAEPICGMVEHEHTDACYQTRPVKTEAPAEGELIPAEGGNGDADSADLADLTEGTDSENGENETNDTSDDLTVETNADGDLDEGENETPVNNDENETVDLEQTEVGSDEDNEDVNAPAVDEPSDNEDADTADGELTDGESSNNEAADITDGEPTDGEPTDNEPADIVDGEPADDGEPTDNEPADITDGEPADDGEPTDNEPADIVDGEPADDGEPTDNEPADITDGELSDNEPADITDGELTDDGEPTDNEPADITDGELTDDGEPTDNEPADTADGEPADDGEPSDNEPADTVDGESTDGDEETRRGEVASPAEDAPADSEPTDNEPVDTVDGELTDGELTDGEPTDGEPEDGEPTDEEPVEFTAGERVIEVKDGSVTLAWGPEAEIPEDVRVEVVEIERGTPEYDILYNNAMAALSEKKDTETTTQVMRFFDITLYDGEEKFEPKAAISVTVKVDEAGATENDEDVDAIHMEDVGAEAEVVEATTDSDTVSFEAESFSIYGVVVDVPATEAEEPPVSVAVDLSSVDLMAAAEVTDTVALSIPELLAGTDENAVKVEGELGVDPEALQDAKVTAPEGVQVDGDKLVLSADALESGAVSLEMTTYATNDDYETVATTHKVDIELTGYQGRTDAAEGENITVKALEGNSLPADAVATAQQVEPAEAAAEPADADTDEIREGDVASPAEPAPAEEGSLPEGAGSPQGETEGVNPSDADEADAPADALDVPSDEESDNADDTENNEASASDDIDATAETISDTISGAVAYDITITNANEDVIAETGMVEVALRPENVNIYEGLPANAIVTNVSYTLIHEHEGETQELPVDVDVDEAGNVTEFRFQVDKFSTSTLRYTVDFYYGDYEFHIPGEGYILLSRLFNVLHIQADAAQAVSVEFTDSSLVAVYHVVEDVALSQVFAEVGSPRSLQAAAVDAEVETESELGQDGEDAPEENAPATEEAVGEASGEDVILCAVDWVLVSLQPFKSHETLTVTMADGTVYVIQVEDNQSPYFHFRINDTSRGHFGLSTNGAGKVVGDSWNTPRWTNGNGDLIKFSFYHDSTAYVPAYAETGSRFVCWLRDNGQYADYKQSTWKNDGGSPNNVNTGSDVTFIAYFAPTDAKLIVITPYDSTHGSITTNGLRKVDNNGSLPQYMYSTDNVTLTASPSHWYEYFKGWYRQDGSCYSTNRTLRASDVTEDLVLTPVFEECYHYSTISNEGDKAYFRINDYYNTGNNNVTNLPSEGVPDEGQCSFKYSVYTWAQDSGYEFVYWLRDDGASPVTTVDSNGKQSVLLGFDGQTDYNALTRNTTYVAFYKPVGDYLVRVNEPAEGGHPWQSSGGGRRFVKDSFTNANIFQYYYANADKPVIEATADTGWMFVGWYNNGSELISTSSSFDVNNYIQNDPNGHRDLNLTPVFKRTQGSFNVWFDGSNGIAGGDSGLKNTFYTRIDGSNRRSGSNSVYRSYGYTDGQCTITMPSASEIGLEAPQSADVNKFVLKGWYDIYNKQYYAVGDSATLTSDTVFYADWGPSTYDIGQNTDIGYDYYTGNFIHTYVYDYNNLFNMNSLSLDRGNSVIPTQESSNWSDWNREYWSMSGSSNDFIFMFAGSAMGRSLKPYGRNERNQNRETSTNGNEYTAYVWQGMLNSTLRDRLFSTTNDPYNNPGHTYVGSDDHLYNYDSNTGYYYYDSDKNAASYNQSAQRFYVYNYTNETNKSGNDHSDFLPYNYGDSVFQETYSGPNYWFGMKSEIDFFLPNETGSVDANGVSGNRSVKGDEMVYKFAGDDDVWVYVDGQLVLDMGGIHGKVYGEINFSTGEWKVIGNGADKVSGSSTIDYQPKNDSTYVMDSGTLNLSEGDHKLTLYYLERGASQSNCAIYFNLSPKYSLDLYKEDSKTGAKLAGATFGVYADEACTMAANVTPNVFTTAGTEGKAGCTGLVAGKTYYIKELSAPEGYPDVSEEVITLTLDAFGNPTVSSTADNSSWTMASVASSNSQSSGNFVLSMTVKNNPETSITAKKIWAMMDGSSYSRDEDCEVTVKLQRYTLSNEQDNADTPNYTVRLISRYFADSDGKPTNRDTGAIRNHTIATDTVQKGGSISFNVSATGNAGIYSVASQYGSVASSYSNYTAERLFYVNGGRAALPQDGSVTLSNIQRDTDIYITYIGTAAKADDLGMSISNIEKTNGSGVSYRKIPDAAFNSQERVDPSDSSSAKLEQTLNKTNNWTYKWGNLPSVVDGKQCYYYVEEVSATNTTNAATLSTHTLTDIPAYVMTTSSDGLSGGTITVRNTLRAVKVKLRKRDATSHDNVSQAEFKIYTQAETQQEGFVPGVTQSVIEQNVLYWLDPVTEADAQTYTNTDTNYDTVKHVFVSDSYGRFYFGYLPLGVYYIYETNAPSGYVKLKDPVIIEVTETGFRYQKPGTTSWSNVKIDSTNSFYNVYIDNEQAGALIITKSVTMDGQSVAGATPTLADGEYRFRIYAYDGEADGMKGAEIDESPVTVTIANGVSDYVVVSGLAAGKYVVEEQPAANGAELALKSGDGTAQDGAADNAVIVTVVAGNVPPAEISAAAAFTNNLDTTNIHVDKLWADGNDNHTDDTVTVKLYKYYGDAVINEDLVTLTVHAGGSMPTDGASAITVSVDGTQYTLNAANSWTAMVTGILRGSTHDVQVVSWTGDITAASVGAPTTGANGNIQYAVNSTVSTGAATITVTLNDPDNKATQVTATINGQDIVLTKNGNSYTGTASGLTRGQSYDISFAGAANDGYAVTIDDTSVTVPYGANGTATASGNVTSNVVYGAADITVNLTDADGKATAVTASVNGQTVNLTKSGNTYSGQVNGLVRDQSYTASFTGTADDGYTVSIGNASVVWPVSGNGTITASGTVTAPVTPGAVDITVTLTDNDGEATAVTATVNGRTVNLTKNGNTYTGQATNLTRGETYNVTFTGTANDSYTVSIADASVTVPASGNGTVSATGTVTAPEPQTANLTVNVVVDHWYYSDGVTQASAPTSGWIWTGLYPTGVDNDVFTKTFGNAESWAYTQSATVDSDHTYWLNHAVYEDMVNGVQTTLGQVSVTSNNRYSIAYDSDTVTIHMDVTLAEDAPVNPEPTVNTVVLKVQNGTSQNYINCVYEKSPNGMWRVNNDPDTQFKWPDNKESWYGTLNNVELSAQGVTAGKQYFIQTGFASDAGWTVSGTTGSNATIAENGYVVFTAVSGTTTITLSYGTSSFASSTQLARVPFQMVPSSEFIVVDKGFSIADLFFPTAYADGEISVYNKLEAAGAIAVTAAERSDFEVVLNSTATPSQGIAVNGWSYTWSDLPKTELVDGVVRYVYYLVEEKETSNPNVESVSYSYDEPDGEARYHVVTVTNTEKKGELTVTKTVSGTNVGTYSIGVHDANGHYYNLDGTDKGTEPFYVTFVMNQSRTWSNLLKGTYTVVEQDASEDGYTWTYSGTGDIEVTAGGKASKTVNNDYEEKPGSLKIRKTVQVNGQTPTTARDMALVQGDYVFTIASTTLNPQVTRQITIHFNENGVATSVTGDEYATLEDGVVTVTKLKADDYTVTEQTPTNGTSLVSGIANPKTVTVSKGDIAQVQTAAFTNNIDTGELSLTKTVSGKTDTTTAFSFDISLTAPEGVTLATSYPAVHTGDNTLSSVAVSVSTDADTGRSIGTITGILLKHDQTITISDLPAGTTYVIAETGSYTGFHKGTVNNESGVIPARTKIEADIQNVFTAEDDVPFYANKHFANGDLNGKQFAFRLTQIAEIPASGEAVQATENVKLASSQVIHTEQKNGNKQTVAFTEITFNQDDIGKTFYFMIDEAEIPADLVANNISDHIQYDTTKHYFTVVIGEEDGELTIDKTPSVSGDDETTAKFTNTQLGKLIVTKTFDGTAAADLTDEQKEAILFSVTGPEGFTAIENRPLSDSSFVLENGVYTLTLDNIPLGNYTVTESNTAIGNYRLTSSIEVDGTTSAVGAAELTAADIDREVAFTNTYDKYELEVTKSFTGAELTDEQKQNITFTVGGDGLTGALTHTYAEIADMAGGKWVLTTADNNIQPGVAYTVTETNANLNGYTLTTTYKVNGADAEVPTVTLENSQYTGASIELINHYRDARLVVTKTIAGIPENDLAAALSRITFTIEDVTEGEGAKTATFNGVTLSATDLNAATGRYEKTFTSADGIIPGHTYKVTETATAPDGRTLKTTTYQVAASEAAQTGTEGSVTLDSGDPTSSGEIDFTNVYTTPTSYTPRVVKALVWTDTETPVTSKWPVEGFTFTLHLASAVDGKTPISFTRADESVTIFSNTEGLTKAFSTIPFTVAGTYTFTITETVPDDAVNGNVSWKDADPEQRAAGGLWKLNGITYNASPVTVVVTVTEDETTHALSASATYGGATVDAATITNTYETTSTDAPVEVTKALVWKDTEAQIPADAKWPANGFEFTLAYVSGVGEGNAKFENMSDAGVTLPTTQVVSAYATTDNHPGTTAKKAMFGNIHFEKAGTFTFTLTETVPSDAVNVSNVIWASADVEQKKACDYKFRKDGITYDGEPKTVTITVVDNNGVLEASVAYPGAKASLTVTNTYDTLPTSYRPKADKVLKLGESDNDAPSSRWPREGFTFTLEAVDGVAEDGVTGISKADVPMPEGVTETIKYSTGTDGEPEKVKNPEFGVIPYNAAGTYNYTITETVPNDAVNEAGVTWENATDDQKAAGGFRKDGITYNNAPVTVQVVVVDLGGQLCVYSVAYGGEPATETAITTAKATVVNTVETIPFEFDKKWFPTFEYGNPMTWPEDVESIEVTIGRRLMYMSGEQTEDGSLSTTYKVEEGLKWVYTLSMKEDPVTGTRTATATAKGTAPAMTVTVTGENNNIYHYKLSDLDKYGSLEDSGKVRQGTWEYFVSETKVDGYTTVYKDADGNEIPGASATWNGGAIENHYVTFSLPNTGGMGTTTIYIAGASLLILAVLGFIWLNRKRDDGAGI